MYTEISSAMVSAKAALAFIKAANSLSNYNELVAAVSEVNAKLMDANVAALASHEKQTALTEKVRSLEEKLMESEDWERKSQDYILQSVGVEGRHFAQIYKPSVQVSQAKHWACAKCFQERKIYILSACNRHKYKCPNCGSEIAPTIDGGMLSPIESAYE